MPLQLLHYYAEHIAFQQECLGTLCDGTNTLISDHGIRVFLLLAEALSGGSFILEESIEKDMVLAALYHDVIEDTCVTAEMLVKRTNSTVVGLIEELTIDFEGKTIQESVSCLCSVSRSAALIKIVDIIDNVEKSRFLLRSNSQGFYTGFFLPLLDEYKKIYIKRSQELEKEFAVFKILYDRMLNSIYQLQRDIQLMRKLGLEL
jgi:(p)ppGpp synthase/HD superfamily hydrolase